MHLHDKPTSFLINAEERIKDLTEWLESGEMPLQEKNIETVIKEYKLGAVRISTISSGLSTRNNTKDSFLISPFSTHNRERFVFIHLTSVPNDSLYILLLKRHLSVV